MIDMYVNPFDLYSAAREYVTDPLTEEESHDFATFVLREVDWRNGQDADLRVLWDRYIRSR